MKCKPELATSLSSDKIKPLALQKMAKAIASSYGDKGAIVLTCGEEGVRVGMAGLSPDEAERALCIAIHYNIKFSDEETTS